MSDIYFYKNRQFMLGHVIKTLVLRVPLIQRFMSITIENLYGGSSFYILICNISSQRETEKVRCKVK